MASLSPKEGRMVEFDFVRQFFPGISDETAHDLLIECSRWPTAGFEADIQEIAHLSNGKAYKAFQIEEERYTAV